VVASAQVPNLLLAPEPYVWLISLTRRCAHPKVLSMPNCYIIAEIGINHNGDLPTAFKLIDVAASVGCDAVKFQKRTIERVYSTEELARLRTSVFGSTNRDLKRGLEFSVAEYAKLFDYAAGHGLDAFASVWDEQSVSDIASLRPRYIKVPSPLIRHHRLLAACRETGIPVILSTGGAELPEIQSALDSLGQVAFLLHCVSMYPCPLDSSNIQQMETIKQFGMPVGYSSHELEPYAVFAAVALGASAIERHICLDRSIWGSDQAMSTEPDEFDALVTGVRSVERCLGSPDVVRLPAEEPAISKLSRECDFSPQE
jgi:N-acetylneuraminate synthase